MDRLDSRRLTGPNLLLDRPGAIIEVSLSPEQAAAAVAAWASQVRRMLDAVGWTGEEIAARTFAGGASLAISAPIDALYSATEINDWAWDAVEAELAGRQGPDFQSSTARLRDEIARESESAPPRPAGCRGGPGGLLPVGRPRRLGGPRQGLAHLAHPRPPRSGGGRLEHGPRHPRAAGDRDQRQDHHRPAARGHGDASEQMAGVTSTDQIEVGGELIERGDFSGPGGARTLLRDRRVEVAILETARGGLLRRGLAVDRADAALVTNIAADHLGEFGILDLPSLAAAKLVVTRAVGPEGRIVLNADDPQLVAAAAALSAPILWFSLDSGNPVVQQALAAGGEAAFLQDGALVLARGGENRKEIIEITRVEAVPVTFGGAARHNVANALAAIGMASAIGIPAEAMATGLRRVGNSPEDNPGRANLFERDGVRILLDYAHNPHGLTALLDIARTLPAERRLLVLGQAGDRDDEALRDFARAALPFQPDRIVVKELPEMLRGRQPGEVPAILEDELRRLGIPPERIERAGSELEGVERRWRRRGRGIWWCCWCTPSGRRCWG